VAKPTTAKRGLVVCVKNDGIEAPLERRKIDVLIEGREARGRGLVRMIDESGEDFLYPRKMFLAISLPQPIRRAVLIAASPANEHEPIAGGLRPLVLGRLSATLRIK
jgi:hypothetical protein